MNDVVIIRDQYNVVCDKNKTVNNTSITQSQPLGGINRQTPESGLLMDLAYTELCNEYTFASYGLVWIPGCQRCRSV